MFQKYLYGAKAILCWAISGFPCVPSEVQKERMSKCVDCPLLSRRPIKTCQDCGCILQLKTRIAGESCPQAEWLEHDSD